MNGKILYPVILAAFALNAAGALAQQAGDVELHTLRVRDTIYMIVGGGGNTTVQIGDQGILIVDTKSPPAAEALLATIRDIVQAPAGFVVSTHDHPGLEERPEQLQARLRGKADRPIRFILNTHDHQDHTGGNVAIATAGRRVAGGNFARDIADAAEGADIIAHENVLLRLSAPSGEEAAMAPEGWPTSTFFGAQKEMYFNGEAVRIHHEPAAHTDGDTIVFFRRSDVIAAGDVYLATLYPVIDVAAGGTVNGIIDALNHIIDLSTPAFGQEGGTLIIPGHGRLSNIGDVINYRDMVTIIRDRIQHMIGEGMSLDEVKAARPTRDYDPLYGATEGFWTTEMFIEAVFENLGPNN